MNGISQPFANPTAPRAFATPASGAGTPSAQGGSQASPSNQLNANSFITLLTAQLQAQDPLNPLDPSQLVGELTSINTLQQTLQIRQDLDALVAATTNAGKSGSSGGGSSSGGTSGGGSTPGSTSSKI